MKTVEVPVSVPENGACELCVSRLQNAVTLLRGVAGVDFDSARAALEVEYDPEEASLDRLVDVARSLDLGIASRYTHETLRVTDLDCADCAAKLDAALARAPGVIHAATSFAAGTIRLEYEPAVVSRAEIVGRIQSLGYGVADPAPPADQAVASRYRLTGLDCADCARSVERNVGSLDGVLSASVDFTAATLAVQHAARVTPDRIVRVVEASGYGAIPLGGGQVAPAQKAGWLRNRRNLTTLAALGALGLGMLVEHLAGGTGIPSWPLYAAAILLGGYRVARSGLYGLVHARTADMNLLMTIAVVGAAAIGAWSEGATVVCLFALGNALEAYTVERSRNAVRSLLDLTPRRARVRRNGALVEVDAAEIAVGEVAAVREGERVPIDGGVESGAASVSQAAVTGEATPVAKAPGDEVFAGSVVEEGYLELRSTRPYSENTVARIARLVEEAQARRARTERWVDSFARVYTPAVIAIAALIAVVPPLVLGAPFAEWFYRALVLLVVSCPCALVISTPVTIVAAIARLSAAGVLVKGGSHLESLAHVRAIAFDKTGTLTTGHPDVVEVVPVGETRPGDVLRLAASLEARSHHPIADAIRRAAERDARANPGEACLASRPTPTEIVPGRGVRGSDGADGWLLGSPRLAEELGVDLAAVADSVASLERDGHTAIVLARNAEPLGLIALADRPRPGVRQAVEAVRQSGVSRVVILTGDQPASASAVAAAVGADEWRAGLRPAEKVSAVGELRERYGVVAMVGDGVNDAPALAAASVGIALGAAGSPAAVEAADVALMADDVGKVSLAIQVGRRALTMVRWNIGFAVLLKLAFVVATVAGYTTLWLAVLADTGATVLVTLNGMRLLAAPRPAARRTTAEHDREHAGHAHG